MPSVRTKTCGLTACRFPRRGFNLHETYEDSSALGLLTSKDRDPDEDGTWRLDHGDRRGD
jgi:hypothetical protein